ncbi:hypothetical protein D7Y13_35170 [Corallococcus praedator]|uniref:Uncharacterized protein n=1 Tax=Corallococcus praedator TaxID=2316724 RepID=A0ABX9Q857_9BACT|nr:MULTISPECIES: hypothetical protein [Corallococcus]RKH02682.1 hypothetical protein D7X74_36920 [Corallococcus sp. CA047B]RKH20820.1 hypothetical protein D7X75_37450 [Corallococcus sp. CA031C]RKH92876.1 hypothetical protein D7Y13_35170 [Corallococcus praedator]
MTGAPFVALLALLHSQSSYIEEVPNEEQESSAPASSGGIGFRALLEVGPLSFPSGTPGGEQDLFAYAYPSLGVDGGEDFAFMLGAPLRFRLLDNPPEQKDEDYGAWLRRQDWDERSDYGQVVRLLRIGDESGRFGLRVQPFLEESLGRGYLVNRYDNQLSPNYHPAGGTLSFAAGPARVELLASDVLAARIFSGELLLDLGRVVSGSENHFDRYLLRASVAHDFGEAGGVTPEATVASVGGEVAMYKGERLRSWVLLAGGARLNSGAQDVGGLLGVAFEGDFKGTQLSVTLQGRRQGGGFRFGFFGAGYELARFSAVGLSEEPQADQRVPKDFSGYIEMSVARGGGTDSTEVVASGAVEYSAFGRADGDFSLSFSSPGDKTRGIVRAVVVGLGDRPRYSFAVEGRQRVLPALYIWASGATVHFPQPDDQLVRGVSAGAGVGVDFARR